MEAQVSDPTPGERAYPSSTVAAAAVATLFFPVISLIAALFLLGNERDPGKRSMLRTWALAAGGFLALQALFVVLAFVAWSSGGGSDVGQIQRIDRGGPCVGGPEIAATGTDISGNGTKFRVPCTGGGTTIVDFSDR
jgi:hypothetical protein